MTPRTTPQAPGVPTWLDFWCHDIPAAAGFWHDLLGYDIPVSPPEFDGYTMARVGERVAFGIGPAFPDSAHDLASLYLATDDVDASAAKAAELGGEVVMGPMDIPHSGRMVVLRDPAGVLFSLWQAGGVHGYDAVDEPGFPCWQDCITPDVEASKAFLEGVFGYTFTEDMGPETPVARLGDDQHFSVGAVEAGGEPRWVSYLLVDDLDATIARAAELGAPCPDGPQPLPFGRWAHLTTPGGAPFGLFEAAEGAGVDGQEEQQ